MLVEAVRIRCQMGSLRTHCVRSYYCATCFTLAWRRISVTSIRVSFTDSSIASVHQQFRSLLSRNLPSRRYCFSLRVKASRHFFCTAFSNRPLITSRYDMLSRSRHGRHLQNMSCKHKNDGNNMQIRMCVQVIKRASVIVSKYSRHITIEFEVANLRLIQT